jgi:rhodanese-related sulfurtransferase
METINASGFTSRLNSGEPLHILDVREEIEYSTYNIGGKNVPLPTFEQHINKLGYNKTDEIIVICTMGLRSETACNLLHQHGYTNARNLSGGLIALQKLDHKTH